MDLKEIGVDTRNWVNSVQDRVYWRALVHETLNVRIPYAMELVIMDIIWDKLDFSVVPRRNNT